MGKVIDLALFRMLGSAVESTVEDDAKILDPYEFFSKYAEEVGIRYEDNTKGKTRLTKEALERIRKATNERIKEEYKHKICD